MPKTVDLSQEELTQAIELAEESGPFATITELYKAVGDLLKVSPATVCNRIKQWSVAHKTKAARQRQTANKPKPSAEHRPATITRQTLIIITPAGECPHKLKSTDPEDVSQWIEAVQSHAESNRQYLKPEAFVYFSRQFFDIGTDEYDLVKEHILSFFQVEPQSSIE